jgi:oxygen-independent coproporphyrinogen-3 oxidase
MELNPEHVSQGSARAWRRLGVRCASLGLQSLDDEVLARLGRSHDAAAARRAFACLREAGLETVSIDLIFGLDGQQPSAWQRQLAAAADLGPDHVSCYQLTIHPGTRLGKASDRGEVRLPDEDRQAELYLLAHALLAERGLEAYEVSNFAVHERHRSVHNLKYWAHTPYLGLGPSAHSFDGSHRWWNLRKLRQWQAELDRGRRPIEGRERLGPAQLAMEAVMLGLRTTAGVDPAVVLRRTGIDIASPNQDLIAELVERGLLRPDPGRWRPTPAGLAVADGLAALLELPDAGAPGQVP